MALNLSPTDTELASIEQADNLFVVLSPRKVDIATARRFVCSNNRTAFSRASDAKTHAKVESVARRNPLRLAQ
jgi:hypothetical protein